MKDCIKIDWAYNSHGVLTNFFLAFQIVGRLEWTYGDSDWKVSYDSVLSSLNPYTSTLTLSADKITL